jgi:tetratricopeptide (TPR) repeat protein
LVTRFDVPSFAAGYALAAIPARFALERRAWKEAAALTVRPSSYPWGDYPYAEAIVHFARAVGAARSGELASARTAIDTLTAIQKELQGRKGFDWATQVEIQRRAAVAWLARAQRHDDDALALMRSAAALEDSTDKHPVTPGAILPAREQLADLLLEVGKPDQALREYEASLRTAPARFNSYLGASQAAALAGQKDTAAAFVTKMASLCDGRVPARGATAGRAP